MQLGELQRAIEAFEASGATVVAISVDDPADMGPMIERMGLSMTVLSDAKLEVIRAFGIENPEVGEMALHSTYIVGSDGRVVYRKVARRRPLLLDALDADHGRYAGPRPVQPRSAWSPWREWSLVDSVRAVADAPTLPEVLPPAWREELEAVLADLVSTREDPALRKWKAFCRARMTVETQAEVMGYGHALLRRAFLDGVDYEAALHDAVDANLSLEDARERLEAARGRGEHATAERADVRTARQKVEASVAVLGELNQGPLRSLWDLKSMLKAMEELHAAEVRRGRGAGSPSTSLAP